MRRALAVLVGLIAVLFVVIGINFVVNPEPAAAEFGLIPDGIRGLNAIRGDMGGMFVGLGLIMAYGILRQEPRALLAPALLLGLIACGRLLGFVLDGFAGNSLRDFATEVVLVGILLAASRVLVRRQP